MDPAGLVCPGPGAHAGMGDHAGLWGFKPLTVYSGPVLVCLHVV